MPSDLAGFAPGATLPAPDTRGDNPMKLGMTAALAVAALAAASAAQAQDNESGIYVGGGVGRFAVQIDDFADVDETMDRYDSDDTAWKAFAGSRVSPHLAF